jgi:hypothetical protein
MLNGGGDDVVAARTVEATHTSHGRVVRLSSTAGKNDFLGLGSDQAGNPPTRFLYRGASLLTILVNRRSVTKIFEVVRQDSLENLRVYPCRSIVVEIDAWHLEGWYHPGSNESN